jgi:hypothetical protein
MKHSVINSTDKQIAKSTPSLKIAYASFIIGTLIFLLGLLFHSNHIFIIIGIYYIVLATLVNSITFLILVCIFFTNKSKRIDTCIEMGILLTNIPIALLYILLFMMVTFYRI